MADSATDWEVIIVTKSCVYRENVLDEKWFSLVLKVWLEKVHVENKEGFQALGYSLSAGRRFQGSLRFCEAAHGI